MNPTLIKLTPFVEMLASTKCEDVVLCDGNNLLNCCDPVWLRLHSCLTII